MTGQVTTEREVAGRLPMICPPGFIGREREVVTLAEALADGPAVVLVEGEAGIGKTRLVQEFLASPAAKRTAMVAWCPPLRTPCTLGPIVDAVRQATSGVAALGLTGLAGALRPLFPEWAGDLPPAPEPAGDTSAARHRLFRALDELLGSLETGLLVVEDLHWADEATVEFLLFLASRKPPALSLLVTSRPEDVPEGSLLRRLSRLAAGSKGRRLLLRPLDVTGTAGLVSSMLDGEPVSGEFAAFLHQGTEGVPLAVEESVRVMYERADLIRRGGEWVRRHLDEIAVPPTVRDAVLERAGRLDRDARAVLEAAAVLAVPAADFALADVSGLAVGRLRAGLCMALGCGLLGEDDRRQASFRHVLHAQAIYEAIPGPRRRVLHVRAAQTLETASSVSAAQLARHFREAGEITQWRRYAEQAADLAQAAGDEATVIILLHDLVVNASLPARDVARLVRKMPVVLVSGPARSRELAGVLRSVLDAGGLEPGTEGEVRFQLGRVLLAGMDDYDACRTELERAVPLLADDPAAAARAMILLGCPFGAVCSASEHLRWLRRAAGVIAPMAAADRLGLLVDRTCALLMLGEEEGWAEAARIPDDVPTAREKLEIARGNLNIGELASRLGRYAEAQRRLARARELAETCEYFSILDSISVAQLHLDWLTGNWDGLADRAGALARDEDLSPLTRAEAVLISGLIHAVNGNPGLAEESLQNAMAEARHYGAADLSMEPAAALSRVRLAGGRTEDALTVTEAPAGVVAGKGIWVWAADIAPARARALVAAGRVGEASSLVTAFTRGLRGRRTPAPRAALATCRATLAEARSDYGRAAALFGRAATAWQALPRPYDALLARERQACCLIAAAQRDAGLALLTEVMRGLSRLGARGDADRVTDLLRKHGATAWPAWRGGKRGYGGRLSPREIEVVRLVVAGRTNREIAQALCRSANTVATQLNSAMRKLGVSSRTALAVRVVETGAASDDRSQGDTARSSTAR